MLETVFSLCPNLISYLVWILVIIQPRNFFNCVDIALLQLRSCPKTLRSRPLFLAPTLVFLPFLRHFSVEIRIYRLAQSQQHIGKSNYKRALNTLRYIHANPRSAGMQQGEFYDFSNYGTHDRLTDDGLTQWHPAFLSLGRSLDECARKYRGFCKNYKPKPESESRYHWGSKLLPKVLKAREKKKRSPRSSLRW